MARYAQVESGTVTKVVMWDGSAPHPDSSKWVLVDDNAHVGSTYDGTNFTAPTPPADTRTYTEKRQAAYPSIGDQLDMLWHAIEANATLKTRYADFHTAIKAVKDANPKP